MTSWFPTHYLTTSQATINTLAQHHNKLILEHKSWKFDMSSKCKRSSTGSRRSSTSSQGDDAVWPNNIPTFYDPEWPREGHVANYPFKHQLWQLTEMRLLKMGVLHPQRHVCTPHTRHFMGLKSWSDDELKRGAANSMHDLGASLSVLHKLGMFNKIFIVENIVCAFTKQQMKEFTEALLGPDKALNPQDVSCFLSLVVHCHCPPLRDPLQVIQNLSKLWSYVHIDVVCVFNRNTSTGSWPTCLWRPTYNLHWVKNTEVWPFPLPFAQAHTNNIGSHHHHSQSCTRNLRHSPARKTGKYPTQDASLWSWMQIICQWQTWRIISSPIQLGPATWTNDWTRPSPPSPITWGHPRSGWSTWDSMEPPTAPDTPMVSCACWPMELQWVKATVWSHTNDCKSSPDPPCMVRTQTDQTHCISSETVKWADQTHCISSETVKWAELSEHHCDIDEEI